MALQDRKAWAVGGLTALLATLALMAAGVWLFGLGVYAVDQGQAEGGWLILLGSVVFLFGLVTMSGLVVVEPNQARVVVFMGRYLGTVRESGFWFVVPLTSKPRVSLRVRNFNSEKLKVNDKAGNPIEIAAVVVWRVVDAARALFDVDDYAAFVATQSETAIRHLASLYRYDSYEEGERSLRENPEVIAADLKAELQARLEVAGVEVLEARLSHLAYAPEIAGAMLQRQQAEAVVAARQRIVEGAVGMVEMALQRLRAAGMVELDEERRAAMINNLLVAIVSERAVQPVIHTGRIGS